jgi:hypothetical protein
VGTRGGSLGGAIVRRDGRGRRRVIFSVGYKDAQFGASSLMRKVAHGGADFQRRGIGLVFV